MKRWFADTHFFLAMLSVRDASHRRAMQVITSAEVDEIVTTAWVLAEIADGMNRPGERGCCAACIEGLRRDSHVRLVEAEASLFWRAFAL